MPATPSSPSEAVRPSSDRPAFALAARVFSFPAMCTFLLGAAIFAYLERGITETDIWWHLRDAATLLAIHFFFPADTYSFSAAGSPWINFEWLSEVPFFSAFKAAGLQGILMVYFVVLLFIFVGVYYRAVAPAPIARTPPSPR